MRYQPRPIDAPKVEADYRARSLADPGLRAFAAAQSRRTADEWPAAAWGLESLTLVALYFSPDLDEARARVGIAEAALVTAGARRNPSLDAVTEASANPPERVSPWTLTFSLAVPIETAGKRGLRMARARQLGEAARLDLAETAWHVRSRLRAALVDHLLAAKDLELLRGEEGVRVRAVELLQRRLGVGEVSRPDVDAAQVELAQTKLAIRAVEGRVAETRVALAAALGLPVSALQGAALAWPELDRPPAESAVDAASVQRAGLLNRLDVRRALAEYAAVDAALRLEIARQYPDLALGPGYSWDQGQNKFSIGLSAVLPLLQRNRGPIAEAEARREEAAARFLGLQARVVSETEAARARYRAALAELADADTILVDLQQARERATARAVAVGQEDPLTLMGVQVQGAVAARASLAALQKAQAALGALEDAVERPLLPEGSLPEVSSTSPREAKRKEAKP